MLVITVMLAVAASTGRLAILVGAALFLVSDALIGWTRFVGDVRRGRVAVMVTYHLAQVSFVLGVAATA
jgi:uncharacterized membrane protein YhhN